MSFKSIQSKFAAIRNREEGVTALEYALLAALIAVAIIAGAGAAGTAANTRLDDVATRITAAN